jgi:hypothetical protein
MRTILGTLGATLVLMFAIAMTAASVIAATAIEYGLIFG